MARRFDPLRLLIASLLVIAACADDGQSTGHDGQTDDANGSNNGQTNDDGNNGRITNNGSNNDDGNNGTDGNNGQTLIGDCLPVGSACGAGLPNVLAACSAVGLCEPVECAEGFDDCDGDLIEPDSNGCESALDSVERCGTCDRTCAGLGALWACNDGACQVTACEAGFADRNDGHDDGCETTVPATVVTNSAFVVNNGLVVGWQPLPTRPAAYEVEWRLPGQSGWMVKRVAPEATETVLGPIDTRVTTSIEVRTVAVDAEGDRGEPGRSLVVDFVPSGWFQRPVNGIVARAERDRSGTARSMGWGICRVHADDGAAAIPLRMAHPDFLFDLAVRSEPPAQGIGLAVGLDALYQVTTDGGLTWTGGQLRQDSRERFEAAAVLRQGVLIAAGVDGSLMRGLPGQPFVDVPEALTLDADQWTDLATAEQGGQETVFAVGLRTGQTVMLASTDGAVTWSPRPLLGTNGAPLGFRPRALVQLTPGVGWLGGDGQLVRTSDGWTSATPVELPNPTSAPFAIWRMAFDPSGDRGLLLSEDDRIWTTADGGASWQLHTIERLVTSLATEVWSGGWPLPEDPLGRFVVVGSLGTVLHLDPTAEVPTVAVRSPTHGGFVGLAADGGLHRLLAVGRDGRVLTGSGTPETLAVTGAIGIGPREQVVDLASDLELRNTYALTSLGALHYTVNGGRSWAPLPGAEATFTGMDVDVSTWTGVGYAVGHRAGTGVVVRLTGARRVELRADQIDPASALAGTSLVHIDVDSEADRVAIVGLRGANVVVFARFSPDGAWTRYDVDARVRRVAISSSGTPSLWYAGNDGLLQRRLGRTTEDVVLPRPVWAGPDLDITDLHFDNDDQHGTVLTRQGFIFTTRDGGASWSADRPQYPFLSDPYVGFVSSADNLQAIALTGYGNAGWTANGGFGNPPLPASLPGRD